MHFYLDRSLPIPVGVQLRGQIEYGIACADIARGSRLPSVRELSSSLGIAPATVSQVYKELLHEGLIETILGKGTYVTKTSVEVPARDFTALHRMVDELIEHARVLGYEVGELAHLVQLKASTYRPPQPVELVFVGIFPDATRAYVEELKRFLRPADRLQAVTLEELKTRPERRVQVAQADLVITLGHREGAVRKLLGTVQHLTSINFIPSEATRTALAALDPQVRLGVVATFPDFLPTMKSGVVRYAPHIYDLRSSTFGSPELTDLLAWSEVIVYATGSEAVVEAVPKGVDTFEYRHAPEPRSVETNLLPLIKELRHEKRSAHENLRDELATG